MVGSAILLALAVAQLTPGDLTDPMAVRCSWGGEQNRKPAQVLVLGYVTGQVEALANACDHRAALGFCGRLLAGKLDAQKWMLPDVAVATDELCRQHADWTLRQVATHILVDAGVMDAR